MLLYGSVYRPIVSTTPIWFEPVCVWDQNFEGHPGGHVRHRNVVCVGEGFVVVRRDSDGHEFNDASQVHAL